MTRSDNSPLSRRTMLKTALAGAAGLAGATALSTSVPAVARAVPPGGYEEIWVNSEMGPIKCQVQWAKRGGSASLYLLDGMRARPDANAWSFETNAFEQFALDNVTLVMPVGGESSWYSDWYNASNFNQQGVTYKWETFLTRHLPAALAGRGVDRSRTGIAGLSMGGTAALNLAAHHRDQFKFAASFSGYLWLNAPGMRSAIRIAMLDAGLYNVDAMYGPPWDESWARNDPYTQAEGLRGLPMYISAGSGIPGYANRVENMVDVVNTANGMGLEALSLATTRAFQARLDSLGIGAAYSFPNVGTHSWPYWSEELWRARPHILDALRAR
ncbi:diacylglycerol O-acyltransferase/trehalose O-mycolyltransferase [Rhodococcus coprophilus]|nr:diacylglycerol O-acyltransferase/trehalose O-mycolyltransferase [Rhodococcus coprophilus]